MRRWCRCRRTRLSSVPSTRSWPTCTFPAAAPADLVGFRALGVSVSDLAAMGAEPDYALIALTLPDGSAEWLERFAHGVAAAAARFGVKIVGGNLARGPLNISVSVHGHCARGEALTRRGARENDLVCVSGVIGRCGGRARTQRPRNAAATGDAARQRPRATGRIRCVATTFRNRGLALGRALRGIATAAIDVSDGLVADLGHLCAASGVAGDRSISMRCRSSPAALRRTRRPAATTTNCASRSRRSIARASAGCRSASR